jgi:hypothetical protein
MPDEIDKLYKAPATNVDVTLADTAGKIWRKRSAVIVTRDTIWPKRCIKCNAPTDKSINRLLVYVNPWIYLSILISILITIILALVFQKKFKMDIPVCTKHIAYRKRVILINWLLFAVAAIGIWLSAAEIFELGFVISIVALLAMLIFGLSNRLAFINKYKEPYVYVRGAKREFLDSLPEFEQN